MKQWKTTILPIFLTLVILCTGVLGSTFVKSILPMGLDKVESYDKTLQINPLLNLENTEELILFPWNYYEESKTRHLKTSNAVYAEKTALQMLKIIRSMSSGSYTPLGNMADNIVYAEDKPSFLFIKDFPIEDKETNQSYVLNTAFSDSGHRLCYYHLRPKEIKEITEEKKTQANQLVSSIVKDLPNEENMIRQYLDKMLLFINFKIPPQYILQLTTEISYFLYQDEILLSFTFDKTDSAAQSNAEAEAIPKAYTEHEQNNLYRSLPYSSFGIGNQTLILFYNIEGESFSGFVWQ